MQNNEMDKLEANVITYDVPSDYEDSFGDSDDNTITADNSGSSGETTGDETTIVECKSPSNKPEVQEKRYIGFQKSEEEVARIRAERHAIHRMSYRVRAPHYDVQSSSDDSEDSDDDDDDGSNVDVPRNDGAASKSARSDGGESRVFVFGARAVFSNDWGDFKAAKLRDNDCDMDTGDHCEYLKADDSRDEHGACKASVSTDNEGAIERDDHRAVQDDSKLNKSTENIGTSDDKGKEKVCNNDIDAAKPETCENYNQDVFGGNEIDDECDKWDDKINRSSTPENKPSRTSKQRGSRSWLSSQVDLSESESSDDDDEDEDVEDDDKGEDFSDEDDDGEATDNLDDDSIVFEASSNNDEAANNTKDDDDDDDDVDDDDIIFDANCDSDRGKGSTFNHNISLDDLCSVDLDYFESHSEESDDADSDTTSDSQMSPDFNEDAELDDSGSDEEDKENKEQESVEEEQHFTEDDNEFMDEGPRMREINRRWAMLHSEDIKEPSNLKKSQKSVSFSTSADTQITVLNAVEWAEEYASARVGPWMTYASDTARFRHRIQKLQPTIEWVFTASHRANIVNVLQHMQHRADEQALIEALSSLAI